MSLVSVATLKEYLTEIGQNTGSDTELQNLLNRVEAVVADSLGFPKPASPLRSDGISTPRLSIMC